MATYTRTLMMVCSLLALMGAAVATITTKSERLLFILERAWPLAMAVYVCFKVFRALYELRYRPTYGMLPIFHPLKQRDAAESNGKLEVVYQGLKNLARDLAIVLRELLDVCPAPAAACSLTSNIDSMPGHVAIPMQLPVVYGPAQTNRTWAHTEPAERYHSSRLAGGQGGSNRTVLARSQPGLRRLKHTTTSRARALLQWARLRPSEKAALLARVPGLAQTVEEMFDC